MTDERSQLLDSMQRDLEKFRDVDNTECGRDWFISRVAWHLDQAARAAPAQPEERVLLRRGTNLGSMGVGTSPWMQVFHQHDTYNDAEFAWATIERIK